MLPEARRRAILNHLRQAGSDSIADMSARFHVSSMTVRRDLKRLAAAGYLTLTHGGAVYDGEPGGRAERATAQERAIGRCIAKRLVNDRDRLFLDGGAAARASIPFLADKRSLTIASNSAPTLAELSRQLRHCDIYCCGGLLDARTRTTCGPIAQRFIEDFSPRLAVISDFAPSPDAALTAALLRASHTPVIAIASSRVGYPALERVLDSWEIDLVVTDSGIDPIQRKALQDRGIRLHIAPLAKD